MAVMPLSQNAESLLALFLEMRKLFDSLAPGEMGKCEHGRIVHGHVPGLLDRSQEGATMVRVGSALFGRGAP
jgi:uncharacterized pyridoxal phosphate-containing UPF0001 family protein